MAPSLLAHVAALVAPPACLAGRERVAAGAGPLCAVCRRALPWLPPGGLCPRCALPRPCRPCPAARAPWSSAWAPLAYDGPARALVVALKYRGALPVADA